ncbi:CAP domain containing protein [Trema orientale]|uniref:CAP domain containing protein n=1 Tax=Trema orientale TaxID=63057 RepID=A0A2P5FPS2_TREOI|nr:CAP domain containing protein [Trema orientale]
MLKKLSCSCCFLLSQLLLAALVCSKDHGNPANDIVNIINNNRTAHKLPKLTDSPGLGCMALQYVESCKSNCTSNNTVNCKPSEDDFTEIFAPNCGVELPTFGTITGRIVGCQHKYLEPSLAFSQVLVRDKRGLSVLQNKSHSEIGVGMVGVHKGPFFWCVLFSTGQTNSTFVLENRGLGIKQRKGCYSGSSLPCSSGQKFAPYPSNVMILSFLVYQLQRLFSNLLLPM